MFQHLSRALPAVALLAAAMAAHAGPETSEPGELRASRASPLDAQAAVPPQPHHSALSGYRPYREEKLKPWREANDTVGRIGGWRAYAREASEAGEPPASAQPAAPARGAVPAKPPSSSGGQGHGEHKMQ